MGQGEGRGRRAGGDSSARQQANQPQQEKALQENLLNQRPDGVGPEAPDVERERTGGVQRVEMPRLRDGQSSGDERKARNPEGSDKIGAAEAHRIPAVRGEPQRNRDEQYGDNVERLLPRSRRPDDGKDQYVPDGKLQEVPASGCGGAGVFRGHTVF